jgi:cardiolipin synthase
LNAEVVVLFYGGGLCARLGKEQARYVREGELLDAAEWQKRPLAIKLAENLARLLSPLL